MTFDERLILVIVGGAIGLVSALIGGFVQHWLSLRREKWKLEQQRDSKKKASIRSGLLKPGDPERLVAANRKMYGGIILKSVKVNLPFSLGELDVDFNEVESHVAWTLYIELTNATAFTFDPDKNMLGEAFVSLRLLDEQTQQILRDAEPDVANLGQVVRKVFSKGIRPFTSKWESQLQEWQQRRPEQLSAFQHERTWENYENMQMELVKLQQELNQYADFLVEVSKKKQNET